MRHQGRESVRGATPMEDEHLMAKPMACTACETIDTPNNRMKGSIITELVLWVCFVIPGLIYSIWRATTKAKVCRACGAESLVPLTSPAGRRIADAT